MQIVCDQCGKKYKTREKKTKPFKIRCTQCPNVFIVDPTKLQDEEATRQVSTEMAASLLKSKAEAPNLQSAEWYAVVQDEQAGPFSLSQLQGLWSQGQLSTQSYVWREGMTGWEPVTSVSDLAPLYSGASSAASQGEAQQREAQQREAQQREAQQREAQQREAQQREAQQREAQQHEAQQRQSIEVQHSPSLLVNKSTSTKREDSVLSSTSSPMLEHKEPSAVLTTAQLKNQRNDNSVLFSLDSIEGLTSSSPSSSEPAKQKSTLSNTGGSDGSGLIDISALGTGFGEPSSPESGRAAINLTSGMKRPPIMSKTGNHLPLLLASILLTALASAGGFYFFIYVPQNAVLRAPVNTKIQLNQGLIASKTAPKGEVTVESNSPQKAQLAVTSLDKPGALSKAVASKVTSAQETNNSPKTSSAESDKPSANKARSGSHSRSRKSSNSRKRSKTKTKTKRRAQKSKPAKRRTKAPPKGKGGGEASSLLNSLRGGGTKRSSPIPGMSSSSGRKRPKRPGRSDITRAMSRVNVARCAKYSNELKGKALVRVVILGSGSVRSAQALAPFKGTPTGKCLEGEVRKQRVPPFSDQRGQL